MLRTAGILLVLVSVFASSALAAADAAPVEAPEAPSLSPFQQAGGALSSGASAVASGAASAAGGLASAAGAAGQALLGAASAVGGALASLASALGAGLVALAKGLGAVAKALGAGLVAALKALGALLASALALLATGASLLGGLLAGLLGKGASTVRAHPVASAVAAGGAAGAGLLAWLLKRLGGLGFLASLYTRVQPSQVLDNEARASVYQHVKAHPGAHPSAIAEQLDLGWGTVVYHLNKLESSRLVTARSAHNKKCYFAVGADLDAEGRTAVAAMSTDKTRSIVEAVRAAPGISQKELSERLGMSQALASWHVKRLVASGVLLTAREGRSNCLRVAGHVPASVGVPVAA